MIALLTTKFAVESADGRRLLRASAMTLSVTAVPQHRQQIQADQMRDALFLAGCLFAPELTAEYTRHG
jgi:hypothetical protein